MEELDALESDCMERFLYLFLLGWVKISGELDGEEPGDWGTA